MNELVKFEKPKPPVIWSYETSIKFVSQNMFKWKSLTEEVASELYNAREMLSKERKRTTTGTFVPMDKTWSEYCEEIGSSKQVVNRWLKQWFPEENIIKETVKKVDWFDQNCDTDIEAFALREMVKIQQRVEKDFGVIYMTEFTQTIYKMFEEGINHLNYKDTWKQQ